MKKLIALSFLVSFVASVGIMYAAEPIATVPSVKVATTTVVTPAKAAKVKKVKKVKAAKVKVEKKVVQEAPVAPVTK
ncbi:MAG: hypothetical protein M0Q46_04220 [Endomicrobiales bacterium]|nr:hypothetical protein [Endomicrobiales bacterium]